mgnify:CR=1 FL=1
MIKALFTEKYRPKNLEELILPERIMNKFENGLTQNMLLAGSPGTGKTSTAKAIVNQFGLPYLYINASTDTSVDVIRTRITDFCSTMSILDDQGKFKVVILDEVDGVSDQFFKALRATMEQFASNSRFIATCNYINKLPEEQKNAFRKLEKKVKSAGEKGFQTAFDEFYAFFSEKAKNESLADYTFVFGK